MTYSLSLTIRLFYTFSIEQNSYPLHPSAGGTIDLEEIIDYFQFAIISEKEFNFATITSNNLSFMSIKIKINKLLNGLSEQFVDSIVIR
jgi:hypothetical protein